MKNHRMMMFRAMLALAMVGFACVEALTTKEAGEPSVFGMKEKSVAG